MKRIIVILIVLSTIIFATYSMRIINLDTSYYGKFLWIQWVSYFLAYILPILIVPLFFKRLIKAVACTIATILFLCIVYGFVSLGFQMFHSTYLILLISYIVSIATLVLIINKQKQIKAKVHTSQADT